MTLEREAASRSVRDRVLLRIKTADALSTQALARREGLTVPGVRAHLTKLRDAGLIEDRMVASGVGRPAQHWSLTRAGHDRFPDGHADMTVELIASVKVTLGEAALDAVIDARYRQTLEHYQERLAGFTSLDARLRRLAELRSEEGYMAVVEVREDDWLLTEHHCPICAAATACQGFCRNELELFEALLDVPVERTEYLLDGGARCAYRIAPARIERPHAADEQGLLR